MQNIVKQIEEMARIMNETCNVYDEQGNHIRNKCYECEEWSNDNHCCCSYNRKEAESLYSAGYRNASDVAREIFEEIEKNMVSIDFNRFRAMGRRTFDKLKKKYTEGEE